MEETESSENRFQLQDASVALLSVAALLLSLLLVSHLFLGVTLSVGIISVYSVLRKGDIRTTSVATVLWAVFAAAVYNGAIPGVLLVGNFCLVSYLAWKRYGSR